MRDITLLELASRLGGEVSSCDINSIVPTSWATDSRNVAPGCLFLAIEGERVDGHDYVSDAVAAGAVASIVTRPVGAPHILVKDLKMGLAKMARSFRDEFKGQVVGVTGSTGKTTTKEFIASALAPMGSIGRSEGNRNTEWTSPMQWLDFNGSEKVVVIEMGMRGAGQVAHLVSMHQPQLGVITNIGYSHLEMVGTRNAIAEEKAELFRSLPKTGIGIAWAEDEFIEFLKAVSAAPVFTFGESDEADVRLDRYETLGLDACLVEASVFGVKVTGMLPVVGIHLVRNALAGLAIASLLGVPAAEALGALTNVKTLGMRMRIEQRANGMYILDAYNSSPDSLSAALDVLLSAKVDGLRIAVLGDMKELGDKSQELHEAIGRQLASLALDRVFLLGPEMQFARSSYLSFGGDPDRLRWYEEPGILANDLKELSHDDLVLLKGSRSLEMENLL